MPMNRRTFLAGLALTAASGCRTASEASRGPVLRVMSYNLHHGEGIDGRVDLERIAAVIRSVKPDLVALQEVDRRAKRTGGVDQAAEYQRWTGMEGWFGAAMPFQGGEYGQVLLSRWPLVAPRVVRLPGTAGREPRMSVTAVVDVPALGRLRWAGCHLDASREDGDRWDQVGALLAEFGTADLPTLLAGDFNATPESRVMGRILGDATAWVDTAGAGAAPTIPAEAPRSRIDYVLASPRSAWVMVESKVLPEPTASDHRPVVVTLARGPGWS